MSAWAYDPASSRRDLRLDFLRGLCLLKMVFNHLWITPLHGLQRWLGFVTAAEGFFLISGAVVGIVYRRRIESTGLGSASRQLLARSAQLYVANLTLVLVFLALETAGLLSGNHFARLWRDGSFAWTGLLALDQPYYLHVLPRYVVFLAIAPMVLWALSRGRTAWVIAASAALYLLSRVLPGGPRLPGLEGGGFLAFPVLAWQLLFVAGLVLGFHRQRLARLWQRAGHRRLAVALGLGALAFVLLKIGLDKGLLTLPREALFGRTGLGPGRLLNLAVFFGLCFLVVDRLWRPLARVLGPVLLPFGQHSLYVFLLHVLLAGLSIPLLPVLAAGLLDVPLLLLLLDLLLIALLVVAVRKRVLFGFVPS